MYCSVNIFLVCPVNSFLYCSYICCTEAFVEEYALTIVIKVQNLHLNVQFSIHFSSCHATD